MFRSERVNWGLVGVSNSAATESHFREIYPDCLRVMTPYLTIKHPGMVSIAGG